MKVILTSLAKKSYHKNISYLEEYWNLEVVKKFILEVERSIKIIIENPHCFQDWEYDNSFKKGFINKQISFYYKIYTHEIVIYLFWNNYDNHDKLKFELLSL